MESTCIRHLADAKEKELLLGTLIRIAPLSDNKLKDAQNLLGTSTIGPHPARPVPAIAPHDSPTSADVCGSAIGRAIPTQRVPVDRARFREVDQHHVEQALRFEARVFRASQHEAPAPNLAGILAGDMGHGQHRGRIEGCSVHCR